MRSTMPFPPILFLGVGAATAIKGEGMSSWRRRVRECRGVKEGVTSVKRLVFMNQSPGAGLAREFALELGARADVKQLQPFGQKLPNQAGKSA